MGEETERVDGYKRVLHVELQDCGCAERYGVVSLVRLDDGSYICPNCEKTLVVEKAMLFGCPKCVKPRLKELDDIEKELSG